MRRRRKGRRLWRERTGGRRAATSGEQRAKRRVSIAASEAAEDRFLVPHLRLADLSGVVGIDLVEEVQEGLLAVVDGALE